MTRDEFEGLPEFVGAKDVRDLLGISKASLEALVGSRPKLTRKLPGMSNRKFVRDQVLLLLREDGTSADAPGNVRRG